MGGETPAVSEPDDPWQREPGPEAFGRSLSDLPGHLKAHHGWTDEALAANDGNLRRMHFHEHSREERDHLTIDWGA
jgi:hypothetical protein